MPKLGEHFTECVNNANAMMIMGAGVSLYVHVSLTNECA